MSLGCRTTPEQLEETRAEAGDGIRFTKVVRSRGLAAEFGGGNHVVEWAFDESNVSLTSRWGVRGPQVYSCRTMAPSSRISRPGWNLQWCRSQVKSELCAFRFHHTQTHLTRTFFVLDTGFKNAAVHSLYSFIWENWFLTGCISHVSSVKLSAGFHGQEHRNL